MTLIKASAVRRKVRDSSGAQVSDEYLAVLERKLEVMIEESEAEAEKEGRKRLDSIIMWRVLYK